MTHEELHNGIPIRTEHSEDAILVFSMLAGNLNACAEGHASAITEMFVKAISAEPRLKNIMLMAIELSEFNEEFPPELN